MLLYRAAPEPSGSCKKPSGADNLLFIPPAHTATGPVLTEAAAWLLIGADLERWNCISIRKKKNNKNPWVCVIGCSANTSSFSELGNAAGPTSLPTHQDNPQGPGKGGGDQGNQDPTDPQPRWEMPLALPHHLLRIPGQPHLTNSERSAQSFAFHPERSLLMVFSPHRGLINW